MVGREPGKAGGATRIPCKSHPEIDRGKGGWVQGSPLTVQSVDTQQGCPEGPESKLASEPSHDSQSGPALVSLACSLCANTVMNGVGLLVS